MGGWWIITSTVVFGYSLSLCCVPFAQQKGFMSDYRTRVETQHPEMKWQLGRFFSSTMNMYACMCLSLRMKNLPKIMFTS